MCRSSSNPGNAARVRQTAYAMTLLLLIPFVVRPGLAQSHWVGSWGAAQQLMDGGDALPPRELRDAIRKAAT